jgi:hypothetical protein
VSHLQSGLSAWWLVINEGMIVSFTANSMEAWHKLKKQDPENENRMDI